MNQSIGMLLLILALCLAYPKVVEFREWLQRRYRIMKRCQYRRNAAKTNRMLYKYTKNEYYKERMEALRKKAKK